MSFLSKFRQAESVKGAQMEEPALADPHENSRRERLLGQIVEMAEKGGEAYAHALDLASNMKPNSTAGAWDALAIELAGAGDENWARRALNEGDMVRVAVWQAVESDEGLISQITPIGDQFLSVYASSVGEFKRRLELVSAHVGSFRPGDEMRNYVVNMARFGSMADDWMARSVIEAMYLQRGMFEEACEVCRLVLRFRGYDRDRMRASTLVEDVISGLLWHLHRCEEPGYVDSMISRGLPISPRCKDKRYLDGLKGTCLDLLERRARALGLAIRPDPDEDSLLRKASDFSRDVRARRQAHKPESVGAHIRKCYPESYAFLGMEDPEVLERMAKRQAPLMQNVSSQIESRRIARIRNVGRPVKTALDVLEPILKFKRSGNLAVKAGILKRWKRGIMGRQLWEHIFEMDVYFRLVRGGMGVKAGPKTRRGGAKRGNGPRAKVCLEVDGCLAEVYSPPGGEDLAHGHAAGSEDPGTGLVDDVLARSRTEHMEGRMAVVIVSCTGSDLANVRSLKGKLRRQLGVSGQPGAVFFTRRDGASHHVECLVNPNAVERIPKQTIRAIQKSLGQGMLA